MVERETAKELEDFAIRLAGAFTGAAEAAATEIYNRTTGYSYGQMAPGLAPNDNFLVGGLSIPPWVIGLLAEDYGEKKGDSKTKEAGAALRKFGEGDICYSMAMLLHHTLIRNVPQTWVIEGRAGQSSQFTRDQPGAGRPRAVVVKF